MAKQSSELEGDLKVVHIKEVIDRALIVGEELGLQGDNLDNYALRLIDMLEKKTGESIFHDAPPLENI